MSNKYSIGTVGGVIERGRAAGKGPQLMDSPRPTNIWQPHQDRQGRAMRHSSPRQRRSKATASIKTAGHVNNEPGDDGGGFRSIRTGTQNEKQFSRTHGWLPIMGLNGQAQAGLSHDSVGRLARAVCHTNRCHSRAKQATLQDSSLEWEAWRLSLASR